MDTYANGYNYYHHYNYSSIPEGAWTILLTIIGIVLFFCLIICVLSVIGQWKMFKKAGEPGWKAIVPIYNIYTLCQITGVNPWWILIALVGGFVCSFIPFIGIFCSLASLYFSVILGLSTAKSFGKDEAFGIGLIFLPPIFYLILGCGKSEYVGKRPMKDVIWEAFAGKTSSLEPKTSEATVASEKESKTKNKKDTTEFCTQCGASVTEYDRFCPKCGHEL